VRRLLHLLFILYCVEAGFFLVVVPWSGAWDRLVVGPLGAAALGAPLGSPILRGAVTGFGLVHLVWGAHDVLGWIERRRSRETLRT
jgi:hypothetical protein